MLISTNESKQKSTEWQELDAIKPPILKLDKKIPEKSSKTQSSIMDEYGKLSNTICTEYIKQMENFSTLQKSNSTIFYNYFQTSYNFFNLAIDMNIKFSKVFFKK